MMELFDALTRELLEKDILLTANKNEPIVYIIWEMFENDKRFVIKNACDDLEFAKEMVSVLKKGFPNRIFRIRDINVKSRSENVLRPEYQFEILKKLIPTMVREWYIKGYQKAVLKNREKILPDFEEDFKEFDWGNYLFTCNYDKEPCGEMKGKEVCINCERCKE